MQIFWSKRPDLWSDDMHNIKLALPGRRPPVKLVANTARYYSVPPVSVVVATGSASARRRTAISQLDKRKKTWWSTTAPQRFTTKHSSARVQVENAAFVTLQMSRRLQNNVPHSSRRQARRSPRQAKGFAPPDRITSHFRLIRKS